MTREEDTVMAKKNERFIKIYGQSSLAMVTEIWVDKETGVNYMYHAEGASGGLTPLLNRDGTPVITTVFENEE